MQAKTESIIRRVKEHYEKYPLDLEDARILEDIARRRVVGKLKDSYVFKGKTVVEAGCGCARNLSVLSGAGGNLIGLDVAFNALRMNPLKEGIRLVNGDMLRMPFKDGAADIVLSVGVVHHLPDSRAALKELLRITKPNGILALSFYKRRSVYFYLYNLFGKPLQLLLKAPLAGSFLVGYVFFPVFHVFFIQLSSVIFLGRFQPLSLKLSWSFFWDCFMVPYVNFDVLSDVEHLVSGGRARCLFRKYVFKENMYSFLLEKQ